MMKSIYKNEVITVIISLFIVFMLILSFSTTSFADSYGSIVIKVPDGVEVKLFKVASFDGENYETAACLKDSNIDLDALIDNPSAVTAKSVHNYMKKIDEPDYIGSAYKGKVGFSYIDLGIWLVAPSENQQVDFRPFLVFIPNDKNEYNIVAEPKTEDSTQGFSIYVMKNWDDENDKLSKRPQSVTVDLMLKEKVVATAVLDRNNAWSFTFEDLVESNKYTVKERAVEGYRAEYGGDVEDGFVITNIVEPPKLPQTGQHWIPIIVLAIAGLACISLGIYELKERNNG